MEDFLYLYNSLTNKVESSKLFNSYYLIYLCGPTVYRDIHIGNMRPVIFTDVIVKYLQFINIKVIYWQNITDINEKIDISAEQKSVSSIDIAKKYSERYLNLLKAFNISWPDKLLYVSENIDNIYNYILKLVNLKHAYKVKSGFYFNIKSIDKYYLLSNNKIDKTVWKNNEYTDKINREDFLLFRDIKINDIIEKRPGWHSECSYFASKLSNKSKYHKINLHVGGKDLIFPHHENELAQHYAIYKNCMSDIWVHVGQININGNKMSKSLNNDIKVCKYIEKYGVNSLRYVILSSKYTKPIIFCDDLVKLACKKVLSWKKFYLENKKYLIKNKDEFIDKIIDIFKFMNYSLIFAHIDKLIKQHNINIKNNIINKNNISFVIYIMDVLNFRFEKNDSN